MKKIIMFLVLFMIFNVPVKAYSDSACVEIDVNGTVKKGSKIEIMVNLKDVERFYAASVDFIYDTNQLKVESINASDFITSHLSDIMELGGETSKNGNTAAYSFTFLGEKDGITGSGILAIITAEVLNDEKLVIGQDDIKVKLVQRVGNTVENYSYKFLGYNESDNINTDSGESNKGDSESNTENNKGDSVNNTESNGSKVENNSIVDNKDKDESIENDSADKSDNKLDNEIDNKEASDKNVQDVEVSKDLEVNNNINKDTNDDSSNYIDENIEKNNGIVKWSIIAAVIVLALGGAGYYLYNKNVKGKSNIDI